MGSILVFIDTTVVLFLFSASRYATLLYQVGSFQPRGMKEVPPKARTIGGSMGSALPSPCYCTFFSSSARRLSLPPTRIQIPHHRPSLNATSTRLQEQLQGALDQHLLALLLDARPLCLLAPLPLPHRRCRYPSPCNPSIRHATLNTAQTLKTNRQSNRVNRIRFRLISAT